MNAQAGRRLRIALGITEIVLGIAGIAIGILAFFSVADCPDTVAECEQYVRLGGRLFLVTGAALLAVGASACFARNRPVVVEQVIVLLVLAGLWIYSGGG